jgi:hypothetical protein
MDMNIRISFILFLTVTISSCAVIKDSKLSNNDFVNLTKENYKKLKGTYTNYPDTSIGEFLVKPHGRPFSPETLWRLLKRPSIYREDSLKIQCVKIEFLSHKKVMLKLIKSDSTLDSKIIKGRIKNGYFYRRQKFLIMPLFPAFFGYGSERYRLGLDNNLLIIDYRLEDWWFVIFAGSSRNKTCNSKYKKINIQ